MAEYTTKAFSIKDVTVTVSKAKSPSAGDRLEAFLKWLHENWVDPGYGQGRPARPDQGLPGEGAPPHPDQGLPNPKPGEIPGKPDNTLPGGSGGKPDQGLPGQPDNTLPGGSGGKPDNSLPDFIGDNAKEIAKVILDHCVNCNTAQPK